MSIEPFNTISCIPYFCLDIQNTVYKVYYYVRNGWLDWWMDVWADWAMGEWLVPWVVCGTKVFGKNYFHTFNGVQWNLATVFYAESTLSVVCVPQPFFSFIILRDMPFVQVTPLITFSFICTGVQILLGLLINCSVFTLMLWPIRTAARVRSPASTWDCF